MHLNEIKKSKFSSGERFFNRELSFLQFNRRVLAQSLDPHVPLLERLRFLVICSNNLDEFFEIRVASVKRKLIRGITDKGIDGRTPQQAFQAIADDAHAFTQERDRIFTECLMPELEQENIFLIDLEHASSDILHWAQAYFTREVLPILTPIALDPSHPFPRVINKSLNFIVQLSGVDAFDVERNMGIVRAPRNLPRLVQIPESLCHNATTFVTLAALMQQYMPLVFEGIPLQGCYAFRVTRDSDLQVDEDHVVDLKKALEGELSRRPYGQAVRLEVAAHCPESIQHFLMEQFKLTPNDVYSVQGPVNLCRLAELYDFIEKPHLKYTPLKQRTFSSSYSSIFEHLQNEDILVHQPYQSMEPTLALLSQAAQDPQVEAIKMTLYRTGKSSPIVDLLLLAANAGKEVTVVVELRARFDESANLGLATKLQESGVNVVYGIVGYKTHAKLLLVVRKENGVFKRYAHLGTGNYHVHTAKVYTDLSLLTSNESITNDVHLIFLQLTGSIATRTPQKLWVAPFYLHACMKQAILNEIDYAKANKPARIFAKMNTLCESQIIELLYKASQAGVQVDLIVRGICSLVPGVPGLSDNIRVRSIVGRFLEHSRVYFFEANGQHLMYCSSADWMVRNLFHRVEVAFPIEQELLKKRILHEVFELAWEDNTDAWDLKSSGDYVRASHLEEEPFHAQWQLASLR